MSEERGMTKRETMEAAERGEGCLGRSQDDEPVFILVARDRLAADIVRQWAFEAKSLQVNQDKVAEAYDLADQMDAWREAHGGGKTPD